MMSDKYILKGPEAKIPNESFGQTIYRSLRNGGNNIAMVDAITCCELTYKDVLERTVSLAQHLTRLGITTHDVVAISAENSIEFTIPPISALYLGITMAPLNHFFTIREYVHAMNISKPKAVFCSMKTLEDIREAAKEIKSIQHIIVISKDAEVVPRNVLKMNDLLQLPTPKKFYLAFIPLHHSAAIMCSSGTTGFPKGVLLTHKNFQATHYFLKAKGYGNFNSSKVSLALLPFYHSFGFLSYLVMLCENMKFVIMARFEEKTFLSAIQDFHISTTNLVPPVLVFLGKSPLVDNYDLSSLKEIICGAAPLSKEIEELVVKRLGLTNIRQGYGLTETTMGVTVMPSDVTRYGSSGILGPGVECRVRNIETNESLRPNVPGELCFRGPQVMKGYVGNPRATSETIDEEGWLLSGDVGYFDADGFIYIVDRFKELIKYKGFQVPPAEIEALLLKKKEIKECAVIGKPDELAGELPIAFIVKQPNATITELDIINYVAENVSTQKQLHGGVKFVDEIPKTPTGKILRRMLREQLESLKNKL